MKARGKGRKEKGFGDAKPPPEGCLTDRGIFLRKAKGVAQAEQKGKEGRRACFINAEAKGSYRDEGLGEGRASVYTSQDNSPILQGPSLRHSISYLSRSVSRFSVHFATLAPRFNLRTERDAESPAFPLDLGVLRSDPRPEQAATASLR
jgi:hypothetical protein